MSTMAAEKSHSTRSQHRTRARVRLEFMEPAAKSVSIAGTFNDWRPGATPMIRMGDGYWLKELSLPPGNYEYRLVVDGEWIPDPRAEDHVPNPFGGINSVLNVSTPVLSPSRRSSLRTSQSSDDRTATT